MQKFLLRLRLHYYTTCSGQALFRRGVLFQTLHQTIELLLQYCRQILMKKLLSTILKKFDYTLITLSDDAATTSFLCGFSGYTKGSSPVSSARIQKPVSGLFFIEISTFSTFLYRQIHPIKKCPKGALRTP